MADIFAKKILVVDDEEEALQHLSNILKRANYAVISTTQGEEAVRLASSLKPDLLILDIIMPDMDGGDVAAALERDPATAKIPVIFLTGILTKEEESSIKKTGRRYVLAKPATADTILAMVKKVIK